MSNTFKLLFPKKRLNKKSFYLSDDNAVVLPHRIRLFLDSKAYDYDKLTIEDKLCELGVVITRGINLYAIIKEDVESHKAMSQYADYEDTAKESLLSYIDFLRETESCPLEDQVVEIEKVNLKQIVNLLEEEIQLRYQEDLKPTDQTLEVSFSSVPVDYSVIKAAYDMASVDGLQKFRNYVLTSQESIKKSTIRKEYITYLNHWKDLLPKLTGYNLYFNDELIYPGDEQYLKAYNDSQKNNPNKQLILQVPPEPWTANILNSNLVLLSMNPGYVEHLNKNLANMFRPQMAEEIMEDKRCVLSMEGGTFDKYEPTRILGDYYWRKILSQLGRSIYGEEHQEEIFSQVSLCQYLAYTSSESVQMKDLLPSQRLTKMVLFYLATSQKNVKFLVLRSSKCWKSLMGEGLWNYLLVNERLFVSEHYMRQNISEKNIGTENYKKIKRFLKGNR